MVKSTGELVRAYYTSVGRNTNLLLGMVIDNRGLVPKTDTDIFKEFGREIEKRFENPIAEIQGKGTELILELLNPQIINQIMLMEDISEGHAIREYQIYSFKNNRWILICEGECVGHKAIRIVKSLEVSKLRLNCIKTVKAPIITKFAVYNIEPLPKKPGIVKRLVRWIRILRNIKTIIM